MRSVRARDLLFFLVGSIAAPFAMLLVFSNVAAAQPSTEEGRFVVNFTGFGTSQAKPVTVSDGKVTGVTDTVLTAINAAGGGFLHQLTGRCVGRYIADQNAGTYEWHGNCNYVDGDGDLIYEQADFDEQPVAPVNIGTGRWLGGTGKYAKLSGVFEIRTISLRPAREDVIQYIGSKDGTYRLPQP